MIKKSGKVKDLLEGPEAKTLLIRFRDRVTAGDGEKEAIFKGKGRLCASISAYLFELLEEEGIKTHFLGVFSPDTLLVKELKMYLLEVVVRNFSAGSLVKRLNFPFGFPINPPLVEFYYKSDRLHDPILYPEHIDLLQLATLKEVERMRELALSINHILSEAFKEVGLHMADIKLEFGRSGRSILLGDELSPDVMRLWNIKTGQPLDKDVFRKDIGDLIEAYSEVAKRLGIK